MKRALLCGLLIAGQANAADSTGPTRADIPAGTPLNTPSQLLSGAELRAGKGDDQVTLKLSRSLSTSESADGQNAIAYVNVGSITFSTPLNKQSSAELLTLDGMATASSIAFTYSSFRAGLRRPDKDVQAAKDAICAAVLATQQAKTGTTAPPQGTSCDTEQVQRYGTSEQQQAWEQLFFGTNPRPTSLWGASAELGFPSHDYINTATLATENSHERPWSLGVYYALKPNRSPYMYTINAKYQRSYEDAKDGVLCPLAAPSGAANLTCVSGKLGAPQRKVKRLVVFDMRRDLGGMAIGLSITHDFASPATTVELPLYLIKGADGKLSGGVKFGYRSDTGEYGAGLFVGSTFGMFD